ncbi:hypothetical protein [Formosa haliotis]|uniref:hypothetical protein n=1 Tax=Formosa haliotis TaxID=1555194 RepID=UPI000824442D|nr:hypothetical protein [Formosa haliotis]
MKKLVLIALISLGSFACMQAQTVVRSTTTTTTTHPQQTVYRPVSSGHTGLNFGASFMLPIADLSDYSSAGLSIDVNYLYPVVPQLSMGIASGYGIVFGDDYEGVFVEYEGEDFQFIPVAVATRYVPTPKIEFGADLGYAIGISDSFDGGFYYRPVFAFNLSDLVQLNFSYTGVSNNNSWVTWSTLNFGVMLNLN